MGKAAKEVAVPPVFDMPFELGVFLDTLPPDKQKEIMTWLNSTPDVVSKMKAVLSPVLSQ